MSDRGARRWCAVGGVLAVAALAVAVLAPGIPPASESSAATVSSWVVSHRTALRIAAMATPFTLFFGVFFLAGLYGLLHRPGATVLPLAAVLAGLTTLLLPMVGAIAEGALVYSTATLGSAPLDRFVFDVLSLSGVLPFIPAAAMTGATSLQGREGKALPSWLVAFGWLYVPVGILGSVSAASDNAVWFLVSGAALALLGLWILAASLVMWRSGD